MSLLSAPLWVLQHQNWRVPKQCSHSTCCGGVEMMRWMMSLKKKQFMFTHGRTARRSITFIGFFTNLHLSGHLREVFVEKRHNRWTVQKFLKLQIGFEKVKLTRQAVWGAQRWTRTCRWPQPAQREGTPSAPRLDSPPWWGPFWWGGHWAIFSWASFQYFSEVDDAWAWDST